MKYNWIDNFPGVRDFYGKNIVIITPAQLKATWNHCILIYNEASQRQIYLSPWVEYLVFEARNEHQN